VVRVDCNTKKNGFVSDTVLKNNYMFTPLSVKRAVQSKIPEVNYSKTVAEMIF
jgi:hypothetical protein